MLNCRLRNTLFVLFAISGFTGLIYESIWSHYLKLFLGHAAYAQALVLAIFMSGMALGAWLVSKYASRWTNLLLAYAAIEAVIGFFGITFHSVFLFILDISFNNVIPALDSTTAIQIYKWSTGVLLILPQSILLGMTFPLMSNGIIRQFSDNPGKSLSTLYFTNSLGAAIGVLISGFVLISAVGLPGTILCAGIINIFLAISVYGFIKEQITPVIPPVPVGHGAKLPQLLLAAAFITGMASFIYEITWLRMLSMVLGASTHSFELMLSAFITGLAFGGLWIRRNIDQLKNPMWTASIIQIVMGFCALSTVIFYNYMFDLMAFFMSAFKPTVAGYNMFTLAGHFIALLIMLPATFCAGMTLPLFTRMLLPDHGEKSIGQIYACNTLGAITGIAFTIGVGMTLFGLKNTLVVGAGLDVLLGLFLLTRSNVLFPSLRKVTVISLVSCLVIFSSVTTLVNFDFRRMSSSVYRTGIIFNDYEYNLLFQKDGSTSTVHVTSRSDGLVTITTNGKPDAAINRLNNDLMGPDEPTMVFLAAIPLSINPQIRTAANIGIGSGLTTHTLLTWPGIVKVDTIEIEPVMVEGAEFFRPRVEHTFTDPRSHIHIEDAKTYFSNHRNKYDLITSEPSNPWVSGVSSLFTDEFYAQVKQYLTTEGMFVQWLQAYEINLDLVLSVLKSLDNNFAYYALYAANDGDLIIVAKNDSPIAIPQETLFDSAEMNLELAMVDVHTLQDIKARLLVTDTLIRPLLTVRNLTANSDFFPTLDLNAAKSRFMQQDATDLTRIRLDPIPLVNVLLPDFENSSSHKVNNGFMFSTTKKMTEAEYIYQYLVHNQKINPDFDYRDYYFLANYTAACGEASDPESWIRNLIALANNTVSYLAPDELNELWTSIKPECPEGLNEIQDLWYNFVIALSQRDAQLIADNAILLLNKDDRSVLEQKKFLLGSLMLALVKMNEFDAAAIAWGKLMGGLFADNEIPLGLQILYGMTRDGLSRIQKEVNRAVPES